MSAAIARRQDIAADLGRGVDLKADLDGILDALLAKIPFEVALR
jgi:hypothetical protein